MKKLFIILILLVSFFSVGLLYKDPIYAATKNILYYSPCDYPIPFSIGNIDPKFDITKEELLEDSKAAGAIWSGTQGKQLFVYDPTSKFTINMVYDSRQELTSKITKLNDNLKQQQGTIDPKIEQFKKDQAAFEIKVSDLNSQISYWNSHGGAPKEEYDKLIETQKALQAEAATLNATAKELGQSTKLYNLSAQELNQTIGDYQNVLLDKPEEGLYEQEGSTRKISIYIDIDQNEFLHTLTHEMGHALGLNHNQDKESIMYPQTTDVLKPSDSDIAELNEICKSRTVFEVAYNKVLEVISVLRTRLKV
jgi:hypothetical protein